MNVVISYAVGRHAL